MSFLTIRILNNHLTRVPMREPVWHTGYVLCMATGVNQTTVYSTCRIPTVIPNSSFPLSPLFWALASPPLCLDLLDETRQPANCPGDLSHHLHIPS